MGKQPLEVLSANMYGHWSKKITLSRSSLVHVINKYTVLWDT